MSKRYDAEGRKQKLVVDGYKSGWGNAKDYTRLGLVGFNWCTPVFATKDEARRGAMDKYNADRDPSLRGKIKYITPIDFGGVRYYDITCDDPYRQDADMRAMAVIRVMEHKVWRCVDIKSP